MLFNSIDFLIFVIIVFFVYWFLLNRNLKVQNFFIVLVSYIFYGWWNWRFLILIFFSTSVGYFTGLFLYLEKSSRRRSFWLWLSILINLGILGFFKYYNFFLDNFVTIFSFFGREIKTGALNVILPVGISFYTFQILGYCIDVYRRKIAPTQDFIIFSAFISFFPQLVAGPIERATHLLPQFYVRRKFEYDKAVDGLRQILWGLFKKIVIADSCAEYVNLIFSNPSGFSGSTLLLGAIFFTFQIYGDFSGYSDISIGVARLFGFDLMQNFVFPYFSRDIAEFWRRWHISLSTWFRDYLYIPLGGSRQGTLIGARNIFIIFLVSGFWHGANWTFIIWGCLNALCFLPLFFFKQNRNHLEIIAKGKIFPSLKELLYMGMTFILTVFMWIFFRAESLPKAIDYIAKIFSYSTLSFPNIPNYNTHLVNIMWLIFWFVAIEWFGRENKYAIEKLGVSRHRFFRWTFYYIIVFLIVSFGGKEQQFVYFQF